MRVLRGVVNGVLLANVHCVGAVVQWRPLSVFSVAHEHPRTYHPVRANAPSKTEEKAVIPMYEKVRAEMVRFREALPALMPTLARRWVVFHEGGVKGDFTTEKEAYVHAMTTLGPNAGFVVARVEPQHSTPITASVVFGL